MAFLDVSRQGLSSICEDFPFRHLRSNDFRLPDDPRADVGTAPLQPLGQDLHCIAQARAVAKKHDAVGLVQSLGNSVIECQILRRALPMFAQFVAVVEMMREMMRIVRPDCFGEALIRRKIDPVQLRAVMVEQGDDVDRNRFGCRRRAVGTRSAPCLR